MGINSHTFVADTSQEAADDFFPAYAGMRNRFGRERAWSPMTREQFEQLRSLRGAVVGGSPQEVVEKILFQHELFGHQRFMAQVSVGHLPHSKALRAVELLGTEVVPAVRAELERRSSAPSAASGQPDCLERGVALPVGDEAGHPLVMDQEAKCHPLVDLDPGVACGLPADQDKQLVAGRDELLRIHADVGPARCPRLPKGAHAIMPAGELGQVEQRRSGAPLHVRIDVPQDGLPITAVPVLEGGATSSSSCGPIAAEYR